MLFTVEVTNADAKTIHGAALLRQELRIFLEAEYPLGSNLQWQQLQPMHGSILEGVARLPKQLFGEPSPP